MPVRPRREDSRFPPLQTVPRVPALVQELGSGELRRYEGGQVLGTPGTGSLRPMGSLCAQHCALFHLHICRPARWVFLSCFMRKLRFNEVKGFVHGHSLIFLFFKNMPTPS